MTNRQPLNTGQIVVLAQEVIAKYEGHIPLRMMDALTGEEIGRLAEAVAVTRELAQ